MTQLRAFYEVAKTLSFSDAAKNLFVSQPAITAQIKLFEEFCGSKLLLNRRGRIYLTEEGKKLFRYASNIFEFEKQMEELIDGLKKLKEGHLRIGTTKTYARYFMPVLISPFHQSFPGIIIDLDEGSSLEMTKSILEFKNSLAIVAKVESHPDLVFTPIMLEEVVLIASPHHPLSRKGEISFKDLAGEPIVMKEFGSGTNKLVEECAKRESVPLTVMAKTSNMEFIKSLVKQEQAVSFVIRSSVYKELSKQELVSIPIKNFGLLMDIYVVHLSKYELPPPSKAFLDFLKSLIDPKKLPVGWNNIPLVSEISETAKG